MSKQKATLAGAGAAIVASAAAVALQKQRPKAPPIPATRRPKIVVAGAGFAGVRLVSELRDRVAADQAEIVLIDQNNYHLFTPLLYQVATGSVEPANIAYPLLPFSHENNVRLFTARVLNVNLVDQRVTTDHGVFDYDYLALGLGSQTNYFGMREVEEQAESLKTVGAANSIRREVLWCIEEASKLDDPAARDRLLRFVVVGAGATGVELVSSMHDLIHNNLIPYYPNIKHDDVEIVLIEAMDTILPGVDERLKQITFSRLKELGIDLRLETAVSSVEAGTVITKAGERLPAETIVWTAGVKANPVTASLAVEKHRDGRVVVDEYLRIPGQPNVFVLGDSAYAINHKSKKPLPPNAQVAVQEGAETGKNLARLINNEPILPFRYRGKGDLIALGRVHAAAEIGPAAFGGFPAWIVWRGFYLTQLMGMKNRTGVIFDWITTIFSRRYIANIAE